jgi:hypothetical protein
MSVEEALNHSWLQSIGSDIQLETRDHMTQSKLFDFEM